MALNSVYKSKYKRTNELITWNMSVIACQRQHTANYLCMFTQLY